MRDIKIAKIAASEEAARKYGIKSLLMHMSALSPGTLPSDAARHGNLYTPQEARDWLASEDGQNSKTSFVEVMLDDNGEPLVPAIIDRARENYRVMKKKGKGDWTKG